MSEAYTCFLRSGCIPALCSSVTEDDDCCQRFVIFGVILAEETRQRHVGGELRVKSLLPDLKREEKIGVLE